MVGLLGPTLIAAPVARIASGALLAQAVPVIVNAKGPVALVLEGPDSKAVAVRKAARALAAVVPAVLEDPVDSADLAPWVSRAILP